MARGAAWRWLAWVGLILMSPLLVYLGLCLQRPERRSAQSVLFPGVHYQRQLYTSPRPYLVHLVTVNLKTPGIRAFVTPRAKTGKDDETTARTTSQFLREFGLQLAINANFFYPFRENAPWDYYPHIGDRVNLLGQSISNGDVYAPAQANWPVLCISIHNRARILPTGACPPGTAQAVAGLNVLILNGIFALTRTFANGDKPYPRTVVAVDKTGQTLWLVVIDGKQPFYSEGVLLQELTQVLQRLEVDAALNLDGGGSTTLVAEVNAQPTVLNAPIHTKIPMRERPVANHLGFYIQK